ncbi:MAG: HAMP domain-containing sensor histidine kinase [Cetobacterium sp.]|uniref:sensor histidine kinase n=1 Tax=unclassified Cetobacterium TaxID=2630983 RepID=UPI001C8DF7B2|nr:HAMP domain-containing sensor histidine kinase [Cetobacterium sp. 2A]
MKNLSYLYKDQAKQILKEDALLVEQIARNYPIDDYQKVFKDSKTRFNIIRTDGKVLYDSKKYLDEGSMENHSEREEIKETMETGAGFAVRDSATLGSVMAYYSKIFKAKDGEEFIVRVSKSYSKSLSDLREVLLYQLGFFILLNLIIHLFYKNYLKRDMYRKIETIEKFLESGESDKGFYLGGDQWLLRFWSVVKEWQKENIKNIKKLGIEKRILNQVISSVDISIILMDKKLNFILKNERLEYLFENTKKNYIEGIKHIEIIKLIKTAIESGKDLKEDIYIPSLNKHFFVNIKKLEENEQYLLTIKDTTGNKELLDIQRKFISNISHELKTPLTNIKGYTIALEDAPESLRANFSKTIMNNIEKLENIIGDFLNISKIESSNIVNLNLVHIDKIQKNISESLSGIVKKKNALIEYKINVLDPNGYMNIDLEKFTTILKNLIENAIIYNKSLVPRIEVTIYEIVGKYKVVVKDNGIGIASPDLEKIFERFYRVDKARTSNIAGTGLGLAIVNELVKKCGGKVSVTSKEGEGTSFVFTLLK